MHNAWKSQAWLDTQQVSKRQIQLKQKRRPLNLSLEVSAKRNDPTSIEWWNCWTSWKEKNKWHGINGADLRKFNAPSQDPDRSPKNRNESDGYDKITAWTSTHMSASNLRFEKASSGIDFKRLFERSLDNEIF